MPLSAGLQQKLAQLQFTTPTPVQASPYLLRWKVKTYSLPRRPVPARRWRSCIPIIEKPGS